MSEPHRPRAQPQECGLGCDAFLAKPPALPELKAAVRKALAGVKPG